MLIEEKDIKLIGVCW